MGRHGAEGRTTPFRWAVIGTGQAAQRFVAGLRSADHARPVVVVSRSQERAEAFARRSGTARAVSDIRAAVEAPDVDAVYIATPPAAHLGPALLALAAGRPCLVEKPFALDADEARRIADTARRGSTFCMEAMWTRFLPAVRETKRLVATGALGEIRLVSASFATRQAFGPGSHVLDPAGGGGALMDRGVYPMSLAVHLLGEPEQAAGQAAFGPSGVDDEVAAVLRHASGALTQVSAGFRTEATNDLVVMGTEAVLRLGAPIYRPSRVSVRPVRGRPAAGTERTPRLSEDSGLVHAVRQRLAFVGGPKSRGRLLRYRGNGYGHQADEVRRCVEAGSTESPVMPLAESVAVLEVIAAIRRSWVGVEHRRVDAVAR